MRIARWAFTVSLMATVAASLLASPAMAQDQDNSVAAAARRARDQKKEQAKAAHVYDNDSLPTTGHVNVVGQEPSASNTASTATAQLVEEKPAPSAKEVAGLKAELDRAKQRLADLKADLDVAQRKYTLDQATYVSDPNHSMNKAGAASLDSEKSDIDAMGEAVAVAEKALAAAQAKVDEANKAAAAAAAQEKAAQAQIAQQPAQPAAPAHNPAPPAANPDTVTVDQQP